MLSKYLMRKMGSREKKARLFERYDRLFPKSRRKVVLVVKKNTEFSGNLRVCADVLLANNTHKIYVYKDGSMPADLEMAIKAQGMTVLKHSSWRSFYHLFTSGIMVFSHVPRDAHISIKDKRRIIIGLWHGVAFKNIESEMVSVSPEKLALIEKNAALYDLMTASSMNDKQYLARSFMVDENIIEITGLPRYDLLKSDYSLDAFLVAQKQKITGTKSNKRLVLYAPTFRECCDSHLEQITDTEWRMLDRFMSGHDMILAVRPHPYDNKSPPAVFSSLMNTTWLDHEEFTETNLILQYSDILIVDFSSIWIDYLLLNRPVVGFAKDYEHYRDTERGFAYDFDTTFPDLFTVNISELIDRLRIICDSNEWSKDYHAAKQLFHAYDLSANFSENLHKVMFSHLGD